jgi:hypothetical protein
MNFDLARLIARGLQRSLPRAHAEELLRERHSAAPTWAGSALDAVKMFSEPRESRVLALIDGESTVRQIIERSPLPEGRTAQILAALWQLGFIRFAD